LSPEDYDRMYDEQDGCAVCGRPDADDSGARLVVDHDHETGRVRALLCRHCNAGLGHFADDPDRLRAAAAYLDHHHSKRDPDGN